MAILAHRLFVDIRSALTDLACALASLLPERQSVYKKRCCELACADVVVNCGKDSETFFQKTLPFRQSETRQFGSLRRASLLKKAFRMSFDNWIAV